MTRRQQTVQAAWFGLVRRAGLDRTTMLIAFAVGTYAAADGLGARPSVARLTVETGMSSATVRRALTRLCTLGLLARARDRAPGRATEYVLSTLPAGSIRTEEDHEAAIADARTRLNGADRDRHHRHRKSAHLNERTPGEPAITSPLTRTSGDVRSPERAEIAAHSGERTPESPLTGDPKSAHPGELPSNYEGRTTTPGPLQQPRPRARDTSSSAGRCAVCGDPMHPALVAAGERTHAGCEAGTDHGFIPDHHAGAHVSDHVSDHAGDPPSSAYRRARADLAGHVS